MDEVSALKEALMRDIERLKEDLDDNEQEALNKSIEAKSKSIAALETGKRAKTSWLPQLLAALIGASATVGAGIGSVCVQQAIKNKSR